MKRYIILLTILSPLALSAQEEPPVTNEVSESFAEQRSALMYGKQRDEWIKSMKAKLPIATRQTGPFGLPQEVNEIIKPTKPKLGGGIAKVDAEINPMAFSETVAAIKVNIMDTSNGDFYVGSRKFQVGDVFPLVKNGERFKTQIVSVTESSITFQNTKSGEQVLKKFNEQPVGIRSASSTRTLKGIRPYKPSNLTPLSLD